MKCQIENAPANGRDENIITIILLQTYYFNRTIYINFYTVYYQYQGIIHDLEYIGQSLLPLIKQILRITVVRECYAYAIFHFRYTWSIIYIYIYYCKFIWQGKKELIDIYKPAQVDHIKKGEERIRLWSFSEH